MIDWSLIGVRFALYTTLAALFGLSAFGLYGLRATERENALALRPWLVLSAAIGLLLSTAWLVLMASSMADAPLWPIDREAIGGLLTGSAVAAAWKLRIAALAVAALAAFPATRAARRGPWLPIVVLASAIALATLAWTGHGAVDEGASGWVHLAADIGHLLASGAWVGALLGLVLLVARPAARVDAAHLRLTQHALHRFGAVGTVVVAVILVTGLVNAWMLVGIGRVASLGTTTYGRLLIAKLALFAGILGLASLNRFRLTPALERSIADGDDRGALVGLRWSLAAETGCIVVVLGLVGWLGTLAPPASAM